MDFQQPHRYMRPPPPPPPSAVDPHHQPPLRQPIPPPGPWYSGQFQYQPPSQHSPSPPPPHHQWAPPPSHSDHVPPPPYAAPPPMQPYPAPPLPHYYPPPPPVSHPYRSHAPPPYHPHSQIPQSYPQDWGNANWGHHKGWEHPVAGHHNEEDWAAKARAWAASKAAIDNQHPQSQFTPGSRHDEQGHYHDQYPQTIDSHYPDVLQPSLPASAYQQYPAPSPSPAPPLHRPPTVHPQESVSISSGQSSVVSHEQSAYGTREGNLAGDSIAVFHHQQSSPTRSSVHMQEVPSSYSSVTGKEEMGDQGEKFYNSFPLPADSSQGLHHIHPPLPAVGRSVSLEQPHYVVGNQAAEVPTDLSDRPLEFAHRFNHNRDPLMQPNFTRTESGGPTRGVDAVAASPANSTWTPPAVPGAVYTPMAPLLPSGQQHDPSMAVPSPVTGHSAPVFGRLPTPAFQPTIPPVGAPFGIGTGSGIHSTSAFPGDVYGVSDRPKKASVPNWLREEIIKKKAIIGSSATEHLKLETESFENEAFGKPLGKADQADSKSVDSSRSTEEEDDDEDDVEATRTAAINQEIKRILTEVLLKVTDELFDEIASKVVSEEDLTVEVDHNVVPSQKLAPPTPTFSTPKASARVLIPAKPKPTETEDDSGKSTSSSPGDILGLGSYASDDEDDDNTVQQQPITSKVSEDKYKVENGNLLAETEGHVKGLGSAGSDTGRMLPNGAAIYNGSVTNKSSDHMTGGEWDENNVGSKSSSKTASGIVEYEDNVDGEKMQSSVDAIDASHNAGEKVTKTESHDNATVKKPIKDDSQSRETRNKQDLDDRRETRRTSSGKGIVKQIDSSKDKTGEREGDSRRRQDERHVKKERTDEKNGSRDKIKEHGGKSHEKVKESDSRKKSTHPGVKEDRKEKERDRSGNAREDHDRRKEQTKDDKGERSKYKPASESSRHKRRRSSSVGSRGRSSKDNFVTNHAHDSSDESSDDSKRKLHLKRRNLSPSPNRSRRRQDSRSPHSKHSQRRHSPYSSLESTRGRRSRSRSPIRR